jgi:hypothetical protein
MDSKDIFLAAASLAVVLFLLLVGVVAVLFLFTLGSPLVLLGSLLAMGVFGLIVLFGILAALVSVWYILYALLKTHFAGEEEKPPKGNYTLDRIKKSQP